MSEKKTPDAWCDQYGLEVRDADGWAADHTPWTEPLTLPEFWRRYGASTAKIPTGDDYDRVMTDVREVQLDTEAVTGELVAGADPILCAQCLAEQHDGTREEPNPARTIAGGNAACLDHIRFGPAPLPDRAPSGLIIPGTPINGH